MPRLSKLSKGGGHVGAPKKAAKQAAGVPASAAAATAGKADRPRKKRRRKLVKREIRHCQKTTDLLTSKSAFDRVVREIMQQSNVDLRIAPQALEALRIASEDAVTEVMVRANQVASRIGGRDGILIRDFQFAVGTYDHFTH